MKVLLFVPQSRCEKYSDPAAIPADAELVYAESGWSTEDILKAGGDAECVVVDAVMPFRADVINAMPNLKMIHSEGVAFSAIDTDGILDSGYIEQFISEVK